MFSEKNLSPQQLSAFTALALSIPISLGIAIFKPVLWVVAVSFVVIFLGSFGLILFTLQTFIYRKIKLIYKLIYQTKASKREEFYYKNILPQKGIDEVRQDVESWAQQRKAEIDMLKQNEAFRKDFLQNLSHEFKTPIFAIQGYVDTLLAGAMHQPEVKEKFLNRTSKNVDRLVSLLENLDEISKLESGILTLNKTEFVIQDLVKEVVDSLAIHAAEKNISFQIKKGCEANLLVYADKEKIRQVIINIISNALKYGIKNGLIQGSFYSVDGQHALIEISDNGMGISEDHLPRVFERFYRTDHARSRKIGGSGLGLSICKHIIEAHEQDIHIRSKPMVGTTVGFTLEVIA